MARTISPPKEKYGRSDWVGDDRQLISDMVHHACKVQNALTVLEGDLDLQQKINGFMTGLVMLRQMLVAFRETPRGRIRGKGGVADKLGLSHNGVYSRLDMLGLTPLDLANANAKMSELVWKSSVLAALAEEIEGHYNELDSKEIEGPYEELDTPLPKKPK